MAWVNCMLFDYKHELKTGMHTLGMWPDDAANPIGTCVTNTGGSVVLFVEFESYPLPVVFPTESFTQGILLLLIKKERLLIFSYSHLFPFSNINR